MLKLVLVDDEPIIRKGIVTSINWTAYDIEIAGEAANGKDALDMIREIRPDIVITDIRMPVMDGLALTRQIKDIYPEIKIVILSGYDDFTYAKEAVGLGVQEYLLKPVGAEDLVAVIMKLRHEIAKEQEQRDMRRSLRMAFQENYPYIKSNFVNRLLRREYTDRDSIREKAEALDISLSGREYFVFAIGIDDFYFLTEGMQHEEIESLRLSVVHAAEEWLQRNASGLVCLSEFDHLTGIAGRDTRWGLSDTSLCEGIQAAIQEQMNLSVSIGIGNVYADILALPQSYSEALAALRHKIYRGKGSIIPFSSLDTAEQPATVVYPTQKETEIIGHLKALNTDSLYATMDTLFAELRANQATAENISSICNRLIVITISSIEEMGINAFDYLGAGFSPYREIEKYDDLHDLRTWIQSFFSQMASLIQDTKTSKLKSIIKSSLEYIEAHYPRDIKLADVANYVYVTPNYLSRIFKEEMGVNFVDWLNQLRVEKAKAYLINTNEKIYAIAEKVGYNDYKYFSSIFKKYTGCTPKAFKEKHSL